MRYQKDGNNMFTEMNIAGMLMSNYFTLNYLEKEQKVVMADNHLITKECQVPTHKRNLIQAILTC